MKASHVSSDAPAARGEGRLRIGAAAREVGVSASALRLWERQHLVRPARTAAGYRLYSPTDIAKLRQIRRMRDQQVNAPGIRRILTGSSDTAHPAPPGVSYPGRRLRELRRERGLALRDASRRASVSVSFLSALERDAARASLATLQRLTRAYGVTVLDLFEAPPVATRLVRGGQRRALDLPSSGVRIEQLAEGARQLEPQLFILGPGSSSDGEYSHVGEEFVYVLDGELTFWVGSHERYRLRSGDALTFPSTLPHRWRNRARGETRLLWINTPPTF